MSKEKIVYKILKMKGIRDFFVLKDDEGNFDTAQIVTSIIQFIMLAGLLAIIGFFFF